MYQCDINPDNILWCAPIYTPHYNTQIRPSVIGLWVDQSVAFPIHHSRRHVSSNGNEVAETESLIKYQKRARRRLGWAENMPGWVKKEPPIKMWIDISDVNSYNQSMLKQDCGRIPRVDVDKEKEEWVNWNDEKPYPDSLMRSRLVIRAIVDLGVWPTSSCLSHRDSREPSPGSSLNRSQTWSTGTVLDAAAHVYSTSPPQRPQVPAMGGIVIKDPRISWSTRLAGGRRQACVS